MWSVSWDTRSRNGRRSRETGYMKISIKVETSALQGSRRMGAHLDQCPRSFQGSDRMLANPRVDRTLVFKKGETDSVLAYLILLLFFLRVKREVKSVEALHGTGCLWACLWGIFFMAKGCRKVQLTIGRESGGSKLYKELAAMSHDSKLESSVPLSLLLQFLSWFTPIVDCDPEV